MSGPFDDPSFTNQREELLKADFKFKMRYFAMKNGARMLFNEPVIDEFGYDIIAEESFYSIPIKLKTKALYARTGYWNIWTHFFRPSFYDRTNLKLLINGRDCGVHGGGGVVVLQEFSAFNDNLAIKYHYCDFFYILAIARGFWVSKRFTKEAATDLLLSICDLGDRSKFKLPRAAFLPIKDPSAFLRWRFHIEQYNNYVPIFNCEPEEVSDLLLRTLRNAIMLEVPEALRHNFTSTSR